MASNKKWVRRGRLRAFGDSVSDFTEDSLDCLSCPWTPRKLSYYFAFILLVTNEEKVKLKNQPTGLAAIAVSGA
jgi:hypothetical protein